MRLIVRTTNAIESVNARMRQTVRVREQFALPYEQTAIKCVYLAPMSLDRPGLARNAGPGDGSWPPGCLTAAAQQ